MTEQELVAFLRSEGRMFGAGWLSRHCELTANGVSGFLYAHHNGVTMRTALCLLHAMGYDLELKRVRQVERLPPAATAAPKRNGKFANKLPKETSNYSEAKCLKCGHDDGVVEVHGHLQCAHCGHIIADCCGD